MSIGLQLRDKRRLAPWARTRIRRAFIALGSTRKASVALGVSDSVILDVYADSPLMPRTCERLERIAQDLPEPPPPGA